MKPVTLMTWLCRLITPPNGIVLDPFTGSGSTGVAARRCGFRFIGIEQDANYIQIARSRIAAATPLDDACFRAATSKPAQIDHGLFDAIAD